MAKSLTEILNEIRVEGKKETGTVAFRDNFVGALSSLHGSDNTTHVTFTHRKGKETIMEEYFSLSNSDVQVLNEQPLVIKVTGITITREYPRGSEAYNKGEERLNYVGL